MSQNIPIYVNIVTQKSTLTEQLYAGIRALDIRVRYMQESETDYCLRRRVIRARGGSSCAEWKYKITKRMFAIHHGQVFLNTFFGDVLNEIRSFLRKHPKEFIIMRIKQDHGDASNYELSMAFEGYKSMYPGLFYVESDWDSFPSVVHVRGKIVVLQEWAGSRKYGFDWGDLARRGNIQDEFKLGSYGIQPGRKARYVKEHFQKAKEAYKDGLSDKDFYVNFLSARGGGWFGAIPNPSNMAKKVNPWIYEYLKDNDVEYGGIVFMDFPDISLINLIINMNDHLFEEGKRGRNHCENYGIIYLWKYQSKRMCLDVAWTDGWHSTHFDRGNKVHLWTCIGNIESQQWTYTDKHEIKNKNGYCLDAHYPDWEDKKHGTRVQIWDCNGNQNQKWYPQSTYSGKQYIKSSNGLCLDIHNMDFTDGAKVQLWACHDGDNQQLSFPAKYRPCPSHRRLVEPIPIDIAASDTTALTSDIISYPKAICGLSSKYYESIEYRLYHWQTCQLRDHNEQLFVAESGYNLAPTSIHTQWQRECLYDHGVGVLTGLMYLGEMQSAIDGSIDKFFTFECSALNPELSLGDCEWSTSWTGPHDEIDFVCPNGGVIYGMLLCTILL